MKWSLAITPRSRATSCRLQALLGACVLWASCGRLGYEAISFDAAPAPDGSDELPIQDDSGPMLTGGASGAMSDASVATGGTVATGGMSAAGGMAATGGMSAAGGMAATGGMSAAGGMAATGGMSATGGSAITGGGGTGGTVAPPAGWFDPAWRKRIKLTVDARTVSSDLRNFPVAVVLNAARFDYASARPGGSDLRFLSADGATSLDYEIESWNPAGVTVVWVKLPQIVRNTNNEYFWLYYANPAAADRQNSARVWSAGYRAVWHMDGTKDSTDGNNDATASNAVSVNAQVAGGRRFNGAAGMFDVAPNDNLNGVFANGGTLIAWIRPTTYGQNSYGRIVDRAADNLAKNGWSLQLDDGAAPLKNLHFERGWSGGVGKFETADSSIALNRWQMVAVTYDESLSSNLPRMYIDGVEQPVMALPGATGTVDPDSNQRMRIGNSMLGNRTFDGIIDEVQIASVIRSPAWIFAVYKTTTDALLSYGTVESLP